MTGLPRATFYRKGAGKRVISDVELKSRIDRIHVDFPGYGYRRIKAELDGGAAGKINGKRIRRVMRVYGLFPIIPRAFKLTTDSKHNFPRWPNLLPLLEQIKAPNTVWGSDITYIRIVSGFVYLAVILDLYSRKVIGWAISRRLDAELALGALRQALKDRQPPPGCIHHSDQGVQYACGDYVELLLGNKLRPSMSRKGNPYDNAALESFMKTLKYEEVYLGDYETYDDVVERLPHFIEAVYNRKRRHSSLGYISPDSFEEKGGSK